MRPKPLKSFCWPWTVCIEPLPHWTPENSEIARKSSNVSIRCSSFTFFLIGSIHWGYGPARWTSIEILWYFSTSVYWVWVSTRIILKERSWAHSSAEAAPAALRSPRAHGLHSVEPGKARRACVCIHSSRVYNTLFDTIYYIVYYMYNVDIVLTLHIGRRRGKR